MCANRQFSLSYIIIYFHVKDIKAFLWQIIMSDENIVFVTCNGNTHQFLIEDIEPEVLQATFELLEAPSILFSEASNLAIPIAKKAERLKSGESYYIKFRKKHVELDECDSYTRYKQHIKYPEDEKEIILNSLVASTAIYYKIDESELQNGGECGKYLLEQLNNHNFEYIVRNKFGSNSFLIAKVCNRFKGNQRFRAKLEFIISHQCIYHNFLV